MSITLRVAEITGSTYLECATLYVKEVPFESQCDAIESHYNFCSGAATDSINNASIQKYGKFRIKKHSLCETY